MTIATTTSRVDCPGNGVATVFSFSPVTIFSAADLVVTLRDNLGNETPLAQGAGIANYIVNPVSFPATGSITYPASGTNYLPTGWTLSVKRVVALLQSVALDNQGGYFAEVQEGEFDYLTAICQQLQEQIDRCVQVPVTDTDTLVLPSSLARANQLLGFDSNGVPTPAQPTGTLVSSAMQPVVGAASLAAAITAMGVLGLAGGTLTGNLIAPLFAVNGAVATSRNLLWETAGVLRWSLAASSEAESGSNAGSNLTLNAYSDAGSFLRSPLSISRATGGVTLGYALLVSGAVTLSSTLAVTGTITGSSTLAVTGAATIGGTASVAAATVSGHAPQWGQIFMGSGAGYVDKSASRALNTVYTNSTGRPIDLLVCVTMGATSVATIQVAGVTVYSFNTGSSAVNPTLSTRVMPGLTFQVATTGTVTKSTWFEG